MKNHYTIKLISVDNPHLASDKITVVSDKLITTRNSYQFVNVNDVENSIGDLVAAYPVNCSIIESVKRI